MYARITRTHGLYDRDIVTDLLCTGVVPTLRGVPGYRGLTASADPASGTVWTISTWDCAEAVRGTDELSEHLRETGLATTHRQLRGVEAYEVLADTVAAPGPTVGCALQVLPFALRDPGALESALGLLRDDLLPALALKDGLHAVRLLVDRAEARGLVTSTWEGVAVARGALDEMAETRSRAVAAGIEPGEPIEQEIIFAHVLTRTS